MAGALAAIMGVGGQRPVKEDQRLGAHPAIFDETEAEGIDPGLPGQFGGRTAERGNRVGKAGAIHMQAEPARLADFGQAGDLVGTVDQSIFAGVGDRDGSRLDLMDIVADRRAMRFHGFRRQPGPWPVEQHQLGTAGEETGRARLVLLDMRLAVADHALMRRTHGCKRQTIGGGTGRYPERLDIGFEEVGKGRIQPRAQRVAVIGGVRRIRGCKRVEKPWMYRGGIVREKSHRQRMAQTFWRVKMGWWTGLPVQPVRRISG